MPVESLLQSSKVSKENFIITIGFSQNIQSLFCSVAKHLYNLLEKAVEWKSIFIFPEKMLVVS